MLESDARHGTPRQPLLDRVANCPCDRCESARTLQRRNRKLRVRGQFQLVDSTRSLTHVKHLQSQGWRGAWIAQAAGVAPQTVHWLTSGRGRQVRADTEAALLAITGPPRGSAVPALVVLRRFQALAAIGYTMQDVCERAGLKPHYAKKMQCQTPGAVDVGIADAVARVYDELSMVPAPDSVMSRRTRRIAANRGWNPPLSWDDIDSDPAPTGTWRGTTRDRQGPSGDSVDHARVERLLAGEWALAAEATRSERQAVLARWPGSLNDLERLTGWRVDRYHLPNGAA